VHNLGPKDVATQFGISERTARRMMNDGDLGAIRIRAKLWRTDQASMDEYVKEVSTPATAANSGSSGDRGSVRAV
jgi:excisionase family DNA binding protein